MNGWEPTSDGTDWRRSPSHGEWLSLFTLNQRLNAENESYSRPEEVIASSSIHQSAPSIARGTEEPTRSRKGKWHGFKSRAKDPRKPHRKIKNSFVRVRFPDEEEEEEEEEQQMYFDNIASCLGEGCPSCCGCQECMYGYVRSVSTYSYGSVDYDY